MIYLLHFRIHYHTSEGEYVAVKLTDSGESQRSLIPLNDNGDGVHAGEYELQLDAGLDPHYYYVVCRGGEITAQEKLYPQRSLVLDDTQGELWHRDVWRWDERQMNLGSKALHDVVFACGRHLPARPVPSRGEMIFCIHALTPASDDSFRIVLTGSSRELGEWSVDRGVVMKRTDTYEYTAAVPAQTEDTQYKYVALCNGQVMWEQGDNRMVDVAPEGACAVLDDGYIRIPSLTDWHGAGIVVPLFSLHSKDSDGIGDFRDLRKLVSWAAEAGISAIQLLPVCDTNTMCTWRDSYPYNVVSVFALNPVYINLREAGYKGRRYEQADYRDGVDYERVIAYKNKALRNLYRSVRGSLAGDARYRRFKEENAGWLDAYAAYCALRDRYGTLDFSQWEGHKRYDPEKIMEDRKLTAEAEYYKYVQYIAFGQMKKATACAHRKHIFLKGDIPIGVHPASCEVWKYPHYFHRDMQTGAPPDYFSADGQNWGFPTYNWQAMEGDEYEWWRERLRVMSQFFDAYRIDHVLGFFRIWEIPRRYSSGKYGHFSPALSYSSAELSAAGVSTEAKNIDTLLMQVGHDLYQPAIAPFETDAFRELDSAGQAAYRRIYNEFYGERNEALWKKGALRKLGIITRSTSMLPCAEDLGMLPHCVADVLGQLDILSLQIQSMPKQPGREYDDVSLYPYQSVDTISTHDMPSLRLWWHRYPDRARRFAAAALGMTGDVPTETTAEICRRIIASHLHSPSMLTLLSFQDWTSTAPSARARDLEPEQINDPADSHHRWRYRTHLSLEQMKADRDFTALIRRLIHESQRDSFK